MYRDKLKLWEETLSGTYGLIDGVEASLLDLIERDEFGDLKTSLVLGEVNGDRIEIDFRPNSQIALVTTTFAEVAFGRPCSQFLQLNRPESRETLEDMARRVTGAQKMIDLVELEGGPILTGLYDRVEVGSEPALLSA